MNANQQPKRRNRGKRAINALVKQAKQNINLDDGAKAAIKSIAKNAVNAAVNEFVPAKPNSAKFGRKIGRGVGRLVGLEAPLGSVGSLFGRVFGKGDYLVKGNSLMEGVDGRPLDFRSSSKDGTRIRDREYIGNVIGNTAFINTAIRLNPAKSECFPWLSKIAKNFDQWEPNGIIFEFRSTSSEFNGAGQALGSVVMATDYDVTDLPYITKQQAEQSDFATQGRPCDVLYHAVECDPSCRPTRVLYCGDTVQSPADQRFQDLGLFQYSASGLSADNVVVGELWVAYDITFYKKQLQPVINPLSLESFGWYTSADTVPWTSADLPQIGIDSIVKGGDIVISDIGVFPATYLRFANCIVGSDYVIVMGAHLLSVPDDRTVDLSADMTVSVDGGNVKNQEAGMPANGLINNLYLKFVEARTPAPRHGQFFWQSTLFVTATSTTIGVQFNDRMGFDPVSSDGAVNATWEYCVEINCLTPNIPP